jgi:hypothetical protein
MTRLKALSVLQCREYIAEQHGTDALERIRNAMPPAARDEIYSPLLLATDWVEVASALEHALAYDRLYAAVHPHDASERMLRTLVARHYNGLYRPLLSGAVTPTQVFEKSSRLWNRFYDQGQSELSMQGSNAVVKRILGCPDLPLNHDLLSSPYYAELARLAGARNATARHTKCVALGADCCETLIQWREYER